MALLVLSKQLRGANLDKTDSFYPKFDQKESQLEHCVNQLLECIRSLEHKSKGPGGYFLFLDSNLQFLFLTLAYLKFSEERISIFKILLSQLLNCLKNVTELLKLQDEYKVKNILLCAQHSLISEGKWFPQSLQDKRPEMTNLFQELHLGFKL